MKIICINDRTWDIHRNKYGITKVPTLTKNKIYGVVREIVIYGNTHYQIECDNGSLNHYYYTRFRLFSSPKLLKII